MWAEFFIGAVGILALLGWTWRTMERVTDIEIEETRMNDER